MAGIIVAALLAALVTGCMTPAVRRWSEKIGAVDQPEARRVNTSPLPRAGGIAIFTGFLVALLFTVTVRHLWGQSHQTWTWQVVGVIVATAFIAITGVVDDLRNISARWQAMAIIIAGLILAAFGVRIEGLSNPLAWMGGTAYNAAVDWHALGYAASILITVLWVFVVTKTVDAMDGVDGLAAGVCAISATTLAMMSCRLPQETHGPTLSLMAAALAGACIGFLRHNYHPAKIIMGTVGAQVLGLVLAAISILGAFKIAAAVSVLVPVLVLGVPIFDFTHVLARRIIARAPLTVADKRHLHHRLLDRGWNQHQVVWFIYSVAVVLCVTALALFQSTNHVVRP